MPPRQSPPTPGSRSSLRRTALAWAIALTFILPLLIVANTAFLSPETFAKSGLSIATDPTTANIETAWNQADLGNAILHSLFAVAITVVLVVIVSSMAAFWFLRHRGRVRNVIWVVLVGCLAVPVTAFIIPLAVLLAEFSLNDNLVTLAVIYTAVLTPFATYLMYNYFADIPGELFEAAAVDGANAGQQYLRVLMPLARPISATVAGFVAVWSLSDLLISLVLIPSAGNTTMVVAAINLHTLYPNTNVTVVVGAGFILIVLSLVIFMFFQRYVQAGVTTGAGK